MAVELRPDGRRAVACASMRARVEQLAGSIEIAPAPDGGTRIHIVVPLVDRG